MIVCTLISGSWFPRKTGEVSAADFLDLYLRRVKNDFGYTGRLLGTGNGKSFTKTPWERIGRKSAFLYGYTSA